MKLCGIHECVFFPLPPAVSHTKFSPSFPKDCTCEVRCQYCAIELHLNVACHEANKTMFITSNMLEVVPTGRPGQYGSYDNDDGGEELAKRVENFGHPIGKGMYSSMILVDGSPTLCAR